MSPRHFSNRYGPYFVGQTFSRHTDKPASKGLKSITLIGRVLSLFQSRRRRDK